MDVSHTGVFPQSLNFWFVYIKDKLCEKCLFYLEQSNVQSRNQSEIKRPLGRNTKNNTENFTQQHNLTATEKTGSLYTAGELLANSEQVGLIKVEQTMTNEGEPRKGRNENERNTQGAVISK